MYETWTDLRRAARALSRRPGFTVTAALTIALGVAATTALWSVVEATLLRPLPFAEPERLGIVWGVAGPDRDIRGASPIEIADWASMTSSFAAMSLYDQTNPTLSGHGEARQLQAETVAASYFELMGVQPMVGRTFSMEEERPGAERVVVIGYALWQNLFAGDRGVLGRTLTIDDRPHTIVGVLPEPFRGASFDAEVWLPLVATVAESAAGDLMTNRGSRWLGALARLGPDLTWESAQADLDRAAGNLARSYPDSNTDRGAQLMPLRGFYLGSTRTLVIVLFGAVGLLFAIAAVNVTNLQLVRASGRTSEVALRFALGGSRVRVIRQLVAEGLVLSAVGGVVGLAAAAWGVQAFLPLIPAGVLPGYAQVGIDWSVALAAVALAGFCGTASAALPALRATRRDPGRFVVATTRVTSGGGLRGRWGLQQTLVASEVALALIVLVGATLMTRSFRALRGIEPGFDPAGVVLARVQLPQAAYDVEARRTFVDRLLAEVHATPGTSAAAVVSSAPLRGFNSAAILQRDGHDDDRIRFYRHSVTAEYFTALRIPITRGRAFTTADAPGSEPVVIVGEETANRFWPGADPIGRRIRLGGGTDAPLASVIGVAGNVRMRGLTTSPSDPGDDPDVYFPYAQRPAPAFDVLVRTVADETGAFTRIRAAVAQLDPNLAMYGMEPLDAAVAAQTASDRFGSSLLILFGALALTLAAVGVYGVMAFYVGTHAREIAIRMAIGAAPGHVQRFVLRRGLIIAGGGIVAGTAGALLASDYLATLLFGISPNDPLTYSAVAFVLLAVAAAANTLPVLRATRIPPQVTLRSDC